MTHLDPRTTSPVLAGLAVFALVLLALLLGGCPAPNEARAPVDRVQSTVIGEIGWDGTPFYDFCAVDCDTDPACGDGDGDGWADSDFCDNCLEGLCQNKFESCSFDAYNPGQENADLDLWGDICDDCPFDSSNDGDNDGHCEDVDNCPGVPNRDQVDTDGDGFGDACDQTPNGDPLPTEPPYPATYPDRNGNGMSAQTEGTCDGLTVDGNGQPVCSVLLVDTVLCDDYVDLTPGPNTPATCNPQLAAVVTDSDGDGIGTPRDNCPGLTNPYQLDADGDGIGDLCDPEPYGPNNEAVPAPAPVKRDRPGCG